MNFDCKIKIVFLILFVDFVNFGQEICVVEDQGVDWVYVDVMDGYFVFNIIFGLQICKVICLYICGVMDVYLMILLVDSYIDVFVELGVDVIIVYYEVGLYIYCMLQVICVIGVKVGLVLNFGIFVEVVVGLIDDVDLICVMMVNFGFGGQKFICSQIDKVCVLCVMIGDCFVYIEIDGGVDLIIVFLVVEVGVDVLVVGLVVFKGGLVLNSVFYGDNICVICVVVEVVLC